MHLQCLRELLTALGITVDKNADARSAADEDAKAIITNGDFLVGPAEDVSPDLPSMHLTDVHALLAGSSVADDRSTSEAPVPSAVSDPAEACCEVKVVRLLSVGVQLTSKRNLGQCPAT